MGNDLTARISLIGGEEVKRAFRDLAKVGEDFTQKLKSADFTPMNELERSLRRAEFGAKSVTSEIGKIGGTARSMAGLFGKNVGGGFGAASKDIAEVGVKAGLSAYQSQQLAFQINDVVASLASGGSAFRILAQQGGQVTQIFGGLSGTFTALTSAALRYGAVLGPLAIAGAAFAVSMKSIAVSREALDMRKAADEAGLTADQYQRVTQAANKLGLDSKGLLSAIQSVGSKSKPTTDAIKSMGDQMTAASEKARTGFIHYENGKFTTQAFGGAAKLAATNFKTLSDATRDNVKQTADYARMIAGVKDPLLQIRLAQEKFGSGASTMLDIIRGGAPAIDKFEKTMQGVNPKFTDADIKIAEETRSNLAEATAAWEDFSNNVERALLPIGLAYSQLKLGVINGISEIFSALGNLSPGQALSTIWASVKKDVEDVWTFVKKTFADGFASLGGLKVGSALAAIWQSIKTDVENVWVFVKQKFTEGFASIANFDVGSALSSVWEGIKTNAKAAWDYVVQKAREAFKAVAGLFTGDGGVNGQQQAAPTPFAPQQQTAPQVERRSDIAPDSQLAAVGESAQQSAQGLTTLDGAADQAAAALASVSQASQQAWDMTALAAAIADLQGKISEIAAAFGQAASSATQFAQSIGAGSGATVKAATGGHIRGAGTGTSDSILSWLSNGEYVIKAAAVSKFGVGLFHDLNNLRAPKFALGGLVGDLSAVRFQAPDFSMPLPAFADGGLLAAAASVGPSGGAVRTGDIVINGERAGPFTGGDDAFEQLSRIAQRQRITRI